MTAADRIAEVAPAGFREEGGMVLPRGAFPTFVLARLVVALTWAWSATTKVAGSGAGWFQDALLISKHHSGIPGWPAVADSLLARVDTVEAMVMIFEAWLGITLLLGFATRLNGSLASAWAIVIAVLAWNVPKSGEHIPESFPVPIGGWWWLLGPLVILPFVAAATRSGRIVGLDARLRDDWTRSPSGLKRWLAQHAM